MNIGIDARVLTEKKAGIGYYLESLLSNILNIDSKNKYYLFSDRKIVFNGIENYKNVTCIYYKDSFLLRKSFFYSYRLDKIIKENDINLDIFWGTQHILPLKLPDKIKKVLTMHDVVAYEFPKTMSLYNYFINKIFIPKSLKVSDKIISISKSTDKGINKYLGKYVDNKKMKVIHSGSDSKEYSVQEEKEFFERHSFLEKGKYLLFVGTLEPRKNVDTLIKAFELVREKAYFKLILCGKKGWKYTKTQELISNSKFKEDIINLDYVDNNDKFLLMKNSFTFIFPSLYEGFGLPVVEAIKMGTIAVVADNSSLVEIIEDKRLRFDTMNFSELAEKIIKIYNDKNMYQELRCYCTDRAKDFNWVKTAKAYLKEFNNIN